jgi:SAM-dependent methyltransferase
MSTLHASPPAPAQVPDAHRPTFDEKTSYICKSREEQFIVPLLRGAIEQALAAYCTRGGLALDAGCGGQPFRAAIQSHGMTYRAMDVVAQPGMTTDFVCAVDGTLPAALADGPKFDLILCTEVLEHVADWHAAWSNLAHLLAPGGKLIVTCPFFYPLHEEPYDFFRPTIHAIAHWSRRVGLDQVELRKLGNSWDVLGTAVGAAGASPVSSSPLPWLFGTLARKKHKLTFWALKKRLFQKWIRTKDTLYLSSFAVLTKPV